MITIEELKNYGADTQEGLKRCMNDEGFYISLVTSVIPDNRIDELREAIDSGKLDSAFEIAHGLKGMYGNLALTPIYKPVCEITELLRGRTETDYSEFLTEAYEQKQKLDLLAEL